jgi:acetyl esterase/lipase
MPHRQTPTLSRRTALTLFAASGSSVVTGCSPLGAFSFVAGRDEGSRQVAADVPYGAHPRQRLDLYAPLSANGPAPVVIFFYGGSWNSGRRQDYAFVGHALAARGHVVVIADYRLVPEIRFPAFIEDGAQAARWVRDGIGPYGGDPGRLALMGHSAGAYIAAMLALDLRFLRGAGVDPRAVKALVGLAGPYDFLPLTEPITRPTFGGAPDLAQTQPVSFARPGAPPALLATGSDDDTVKPRNSLALAARLRAAGSSASVRTYKGVDHAGILLALSRLLRDRAPVLDDVTAFLARSMQQGAAG